MQFDLSRVEGVVTRGPLRIHNKQCRQREDRGAGLLWAQRDNPTPLACRSSGPYKLQPSKVGTRDISGADFTFESGQGSGHHYVRSANQNEYLCCLYKSLIG